MAKTDNNKYGVNPEVLKQIKFTPRDKHLAEADVSPSNTLIQGLVVTPPEQWDDDQLEKAKRIKLNEMTVEQLRNWFDTETSA